MIEPANPLVSQLFQGWFCCDVRYKLSPNFAFMGDFSQSTYLSEGTLTDHGLATAKELLNQLHSIGRTIHENQSQLKQAYERYRSDWMELRLLITLVRGKLSKLRHGLNQGDLDRDQYQTSLEETKCRLDQNHHRARELFDRHLYRLSRCGKWGSVGSVTAALVPDPVSSNWLIAGSMTSAHHQYARCPNLK